jgi:hypothetical protein
MRPLCLMGCPSEGKDVWLGGRTGFNGTYPHYVIARVRSNLRAIWAVMHGVNLACGSYGPNFAIGEK